MNYKKMELLDKHIENLSQQLQFMTKKDNPKNYIKTERMLHQLMREKSDEWMKIYHPSITGFTTVVDYMAKYELKRFSIVDPPKGKLVNGFKYYLSEWLFNELTKENGQDVKIGCGRIVFDYDNKNFTNDMKKALDKYSIKNMTITIKKKIEDRGVIVYDNKHRFEAEIII